MGQFRNARYAPESLGRRLSASGMVARNSAGYGGDDGEDEDPDEPAPGPGDGTPPIVLPEDPATPGLPA